MSADNYVDFEFSTIGTSYQERIRRHYEEIFNRYAKEVLGITEEVQLIFTNLCNIMYVPERYRYEKTTEQNVIGELHPHGVNIKVELKTKDNGTFLGSFNFYNQNNCCGASSISKTMIAYKYKKLGEIFQYLKEDLGLCGKVSLLVCTDTYQIAAPHGMTEEEMNNKLPYLANTKLLIRTGWKPSKIWYNPNSSNLVALYTKNIDTKTHCTRVIKLRIMKNSEFVEIKNPTIGCDPELFLRSKDTQEYVASYKMIKGSKNDPTMISDAGHNIQCDNVMVEYGVPPSKTVDDFIGNNLFVQDYLRRTVAEPNGLELVLFPFAEFSDNELMDERAERFGCDPDFNVWLGGKPNEVGRAGANGRCAGGHIHIGYDNHNMVTNNYIIKALDLFVSTPLVLMEPANRRKEMYGKAGSFRPQPWGVEYRSTSNYIFSSEELMRWTFNQVQKAIEFVNSESRNDLTKDAYLIIEAINNGCVDSAKHLIGKYKLEVLTTEKINK